MTEPGHDGTGSWQGLAVLDCDHKPLGRIEDVYRDRATGEPEWMLVHADSPDAPPVFVPVHKASKEGDAVVVPYDRGLVERAPGVPPESQLSEADEARLYAHYGIPYSGDRSPSGLPDDTGTAPGETAAGGMPLASDHETGQERPTGRELERTQTGSGAAKVAVPAGLAVAGVAGAVGMLRRRRQPKSLLERAAEQARRTARGLPDSITPGRTRPTTRLRRRLARRAPGTLARTVGGATAVAGRATGRLSRGAGKAGKGAFRAGAAVGSARTATVVGAKAGARQARQTLGLTRREARRALKYGARSAQVAAMSTGASLRGAGREVARRAPSPSSAGDRLRRRRKRMRRSLRGGALLGLAIGYLMGTRAGRERYEQLAAAARSVRQEPTLERVKAEAGGLVRSQLDRTQQAIDTASGRAADKLSQVTESAEQETRDTRPQATSQDTTGTGTTTEKADTPGRTTGRRATRQGTGTSGSTGRTPTDAAPQPIPPEPTPPKDTPPGGTTPPTR